MSADVSILKMLVSQGADVRARDLEGQTAQDLARFYHHNEAEMYLSGINQ